MINPYRDISGEWVRGSFHGHSDEYSTCGSVPLLTGADQYQQVGAGFMAVTDHNHVTDLTECRTRYPHMIFLPGFEHSHGHDMLFIGENAGAVLDLSIDRALAAADALLTVVCHPDPRGDGSYWTLDLLRELGRSPDGIEIFNGHYGVERLRKLGCRPCFTHFWDAALTEGFHVWGYANDDFHDPADFNNAYNMVNVDNLTAEALIDAAKCGRCYGSTGLHLVAFHGKNGTITIEVDADCEGRFVGPGGHVLATSRGHYFTYSLCDEAYVRFEGSGKTGRIFLQPIFAGAERHQTNIEKTS